MSGSGPDLKTINSIVKEGVEALGHVEFNLKSKDIPISCNLAASYGSQAGKLHDRIDLNLKVLIAGTIKRLSQMTNLSLDDILDAMMQNVLIELKDPIYKEETFRRRNTTVWDLPDNSQTFHEANIWLKDIIVDDDILKDTGIDFTLISKTVTKTGVPIDDFGSVFRDTKTDKKVMTDTGILRYPDVVHPYFKLYHIKMAVWRKSTRHLFHSRTDSGINAEFYTIKLKFKDSVANHIISSLGIDVKKLLVPDITDLTKGLI